MKQEPRYVVKEYNPDRNHKQMKLWGVWDNIQEQFIEAEDDGYNFMCTALGFKLDGIVENLNKYNNPT